MSKLWRLCWLVGLALLVAGRPSTRSEAGSPCTNDHAPGLVLAGYRNGVSAAEWLAESRRDASMPQVVATIPGIHVATLHVTPGQECAALETLLRDPRVAYAELDYAVHSADARHSPHDIRPSSFAPRPYPFVLRPSNVIMPNDPGWVSQWGPAKIKAPAAWSVVTGTPSIVIAVLDSGVRLDHEDLASNIWTNPREIPGNGVDDDGNGKIDDVYGWHFFHRWAGSNYVPDEDADVRDSNGHGTHVAGIAAAATNNGVGIAGIAGGARIMPVRVLNEYGDGWYSDIGAGILYAADNGARIINLSVGGPVSSTTLLEAVEYARNRGVLVVAAAGNTGGPVFYPAAYDPVLAVAATDPNDARSVFSNYGPQVDLAAPGQDIYSTWCHQDLYLKTCSGNYYFSKSGTSMAAPHVAGVTALIWSLHPDLTTDQVISRLLATADATPGSALPNPYTGWGRVNAYRAIADLEPLPDLWVSLAGPPVIRVGESFSYTLTYGNRGVGNAESVTLTLQLANGLVSTQPPQQEIGIVLANTGPYTQAWQTMPKCGTICLGAVYTTTVTIQSATPDRTLMDNTSAWIARVAWPVFLPIVLR